MKQVSRGSGEGKGELARLDGVKTGAQMGGQKIVAIIDRACQTPTWCGVLPTEMRLRFRPDNKAVSKEFTELQIALLLAFESTSIDHNLLCRN